MDGRAARERPRGRRVDFSLAASDRPRRDGGYAASVADGEDTDVTRRTLLAAERTWLAWWRSGLAAAAVSIAVGGVIPGLTDKSSTPYVVLGCGYAVLALATFGGAAHRQIQVRHALARGEYADVGDWMVMALTLGGAVLALATLIVLMVD